MHDMHICIFSARLSRMRFRFPFSLLFFYKAFFISFFYGTFVMYSVTLVTHIMWMNQNIVGATSSYFRLECFARLSF